MYPLLVNSPHKSNYCLFLFYFIFFNLQLIMSYLVNINLQSPNLMPANYGPKSEGRRKVGVV